MHELVVNLHSHTTYSDGGGLHKDIGRAAIDSGLDAVIVTDHNVWVQGVDGYYREGKKRTLMLIGEEVHDQARDPQRNHLLVFGAKREMSVFAATPQTLLDNIWAAGGLSFFAHPHDVDCNFIQEPSISWDDWNLHRFTGIELWNSMSELKYHSHTVFHLAFYVFFPQFIGHGPSPATLKKWDELLKAGDKVVAIGGSDAHSFPVKRGPFTKVIFPYRFHFSTVNTHLFVPTPLSGDSAEDERMIYAAIAAGHAFIAYDLAGSSKGFRFTAQGKEKEALPGDEISAEGGVTFRVRLPAMGECHLLKDGEIIHKWKDQEIGSYIATEPGVYRVEVYKRFLGKKRGWIFTNPIYVRGK